MKMSRRDTIIIAALLNAGLLVVLFTTALKTDSKLSNVASINEATSYEKIEVPIRKEPSIHSPGDEVDQVLREYDKKSQRDFTPPSSSFSPAPIVSAPNSSSFTDEINAITLPGFEPPVASSSQPVPSIASIIDVTVKKGDVLEKIAKVHHTTVDQIMKQNNLTSTNLRIGQVLKITPNRTVITSEAGKNQSIKADAKPETEAKYYTVKSGDNPWTIAVKNHMKVDELLRLNNLDAEKARRLKPGDQLRIR